MVALSTFLLIGPKGGGCTTMRLRRGAEYGIAGPMLAPGDPAPDFTATACDGRSIALRDFRGRKVLLWFFPKADTPG
jgi:peroxiredoxin